MSDLRKRRLAQASWVGAKRRLEFLSMSEDARAIDEQRSHVERCRAELDELGGPLDEVGEGLWGRTGPFPTNTVGTRRGSD